MKKSPRIGVGVIVLEDKKVLLGKRKNSHGEGLWCPPGGHLEFMETIEDCAKREAKEEAGIDISSIRNVAYTEDFYTKEDLHYLTMLVTTDLEKGVPATMEPDKCEGWEWFEWSNLPKGLCVPLQNHIDRGYDPFEF